MDKNKDKMKSEKKRKNIIFSNQDALPECRVDY